MKVEGTCPECEAEFGIKYEGDVPKMFDDALKNYLQKDKLKVLCPSCENWVNPFQEE